MPARRRLGRRALGRSLLARQGLLERRPASAWGDDGVADVLRHLVGMQAQLPGDPYLGLWSRIADFDPATLSDLTADRRVVRIPLMRSTIHAVTADDACRLRPLVQPAIERTTAALERRTLDGVDMAELARVTRDLVAASPRTAADLERLLAARWPDRERGALANAARTHVPLVQVPPRGLWGGRGVPTLASLEDWVDQPLATRPDLGQLVMRYLRAFGPASPSDFRAWSGIAIPRTLLQSLLPRLVVYEDEGGRDLLDVPDGLLPDPETPAQIRFLPVYDNVVLGHRDRTRIVPPDVGSALPLTQENIGSVLIDGTVGARWQMRHEGGGALLRVDLLREVPAAIPAEVEAEASMALAFLLPGSGARVEVRSAASATLTG
jgi:hypothetical protein